MRRLCAGKGQTGQLWAFGGTLTTGRLAQAKPAQTGLLTRRHARPYGEGDTSWNYLVRA